MSQFVRTFKRRKLFLDQLAVGSSLSFAAAAAGGTPRQFKSWRQADSNFAEDWDEAEEQGTDFIEDAATERALRKSDALMAMILKARRPDKFDRGSKLELSGGISVEGSKTKLLNKLARLQAEGKVLQAPDEEVPEISDEKHSEAPLLPAPEGSAKPKRGSKRRRANGSGRRDKAA